MYTEAAAEGEFRQNTWRGFCNQRDSGDLTETEAKYYLHRFIQKAGPRKSLTKGQ
jgi:hypothetical protein